MCSQKHAHPTYKKDSYKDSYKYKKDDYDSDESDEPYFKKGEGKVCAGTPPTNRPQGNPLCVQAPQHGVNWSAHLGTVALLQ